MHASNRTHSHKNIDIELDIINAYHYVYIVNICQSYVNVYIGVLCIYGTAQQPPPPPRHGHGPVRTLYVGGFVSDILDMLRADT